MSMSRGGGGRAVERRLLRLLHGRETRIRLREIHAQFLRHNLHHSNQLLSHFTSVCSSLSQMPYAVRVFHQSPNPNIFLFNSVIKGFSICGPFHGSIATFSAMKRRCIWPDQFTLAPLLKACANLFDLHLGLQVYKDVMALGFERFGAIRVGLVELFVNCDRMGDAEKVFDAMPQRDVIIWNLMIRGYCRTGSVETGLNLFRRMGEFRNVASWNTMISCLAQSNRDSDALKLFTEMQQNQSFELDEVTVITVLPICTRLGEVEVGKSLHSYVKSTGLLHEFVSVGNALVDFYCKCGELSKALEVFDEMPCKNVVSWNTMISGLALNGEGELGVHFFEKMMKTNGGCGVPPNDSTLVGVLACCVHAGLVERGRGFFASMSVDYNVEPKAEHYGCMVYLLGRNGCVKEAYELILKMPKVKDETIANVNVNADVVRVWGALLSACQTSGELEVAESVVKELIDLEPGNSKNYVFLSNIYAEKGDWKGVEEVRMMMKGNCVYKNVGQSVVG
ncbi:pentatricopeptide repeat-containing protein At1g09190 [Andrographis paniculata]|uniref:pentatricopeptide repeat-containing protein At1g09190 n=1 Tax=Andrographis paniculata TaxID=175694 RepID=UPI0021E99A78|nr:pentatricopeptide repeat-containing protein At1g09190 [Andrographis paniculata]